MSKTQDDIIRELAQKYGIGLMMANTIVHSYFEVIAKRMKHRNEDGTYDFEKLGQVRIKHFGSLIPIKSKTERYNKKLLERKENGCEFGE